ncbi:MAG TPA: hypothetical protein ENJ35_05370 [Gammaproteobacteria bacterium]|nr:hypothetical protein [Gammaproteobacteria bacterium]
MNLPMNLPLQQASIPKQVEAVVERLCAQGCAAVYRVLEQMENGDALPELDGNPPEVYDAVFLELKSIMAVYDAREGGPVCKLPERG